MNKNNKMILSAAVAGILSSGALISVSTFAADKAENVHCMGANSCKGKGGCKTDANACKGQNGCKGKGFTEMTKAKCDKLAKKNTAVHAEEKKM